MYQHPLDFIDKATNLPMTNSLGYQQVISTLTAVGRKVSIQKFYTIPFAEYIPVVIGNGAYQRQILNWRTFVEGEGFDTGVISNAGNKSKLQEVDAVMDNVNQNIYSWAKACSWNIFQVEEALKANTLFSLIEAKELARKKEWDLGIQKIAFMGYKSDYGLLNQAAVVADTTTISKRLYSMSASEFNTLIATLVGAYRVNTNYTAYPNRLVVPEKDFNSLASYPDSTYPLKTRIQILEEMFSSLCGAGFKILPCAFCDRAHYDLTNNLYALYNYDETSVKMDLPLDYNMSAAGTFNGFTYENVAWGQFTGAALLRPLELMYFTNTAT